MNFLKRKKRFFIICSGLIGALFLISSAVTSCGYTGGTGGNGSGGSGNNNNNQDLPGYYNNNNNSSSSRSSSRSGSANCEGPGGGSCEGDRDCEEICDDLFTSSRLEDKCKELTSDEVTDLFNVFDDDDGLLVHPDYDARSGDEELSNVCVDAIENALAIDEDFWKDIYRGYSKGEARDVLLWFAEDESIYSAIDRGIDAADSRNDSDDVEDAVKDFLETLFTKVDSNIVDALKTGLDPEERDLSRNTFFAYGAGTLPDSVLDIVHELALNEYPSDKEACILKNLYCDRDGSDYTFEDEFATLLDTSRELEDFIEDNLNVDSSDIDDVEEVCPEAAKFSASCS